MKKKPVRCRKCRRVLKDPVRAALRIGRVCEVKELAERGEARRAPVRAGPAGRRQLRMRALRLAARDAGQEPLFELDQEQEREMTTTRQITGTDGKVVGRHGLVRREAILKALLEELKTSAWHDVRVLDVTTQAGCSGATFYLYFADLHEAFDVLCEEITARGEVLPTRVAAVARLRAVETGRAFAYATPAPDPASVSGYVARPAAVQAVLWTGENEAEVQKITGSDFYALDEEDRANSDDPEATATLLATEHSTWVLVDTGRWIVREADGALSVLDQPAFEHVYQPAGSEAHRGE